ncbi:zona pellucida sperm-binding protein 4-like isoform X2 [Lepisosteus oculatus]|uniref:zona pellucida sperm-binding protein 4-like isoform X2 n=1 Tax=Lepisosteus oculatus TaxID=7918 RepID=UPI0037230B58
MVCRLRVEQLLILGLFVGLVFAQRWDRKPLFEAEGVESDLGSLPRGGYYRNQLRGEDAKGDLEVEERGLTGTAESLSETGRLSGLEERLGVGAGLGQEDMAAHKDGAKEEMVNPLGAGNAQLGGSVAQGAGARDGPSGGAVGAGLHDREPQQQQPQARQSSSIRPLVSCGKKGLMIRFSVRRYSAIYLLRGNMRPLPVTSLPKSCGHKVWTTGTWVVLVASYRGCYIRAWRKNQQPHYSLTVRYYDKARRRQVSGTVSCATPLPPVSQPPRGLSISCGDVCMTVTLPAGPLEDIKVQGSSGSLDSVVETGWPCGYAVKEGEQLNTLTIPYTACHVRLLNKRYTVKVVYITLSGQRGEIKVSCPYRPIKPKEGCRIPRSQWVSCGPEPLSPAQCLAKGCCVDPDTSSCYYPLEECTADKHFVFAVYRTSSVPPVDPASLVVAGNQSCAPVICTPDFAVFKIPVTGCGTHAFVVGETTIYLAEVEVLARRSSLNYGVITRDSPFRLLVECRYAEGSLASTGYLVKSPYLPSAVLSQGAFGVQLRIATDESYSRFYPQYHRPLRLLLGSPVHLEVRLLNAPDPGLVLLVHYCIAYPRSGQTVWVLLYEGCPNLLDYGHASTLHVHSQLPLPKHHRHFHIQTFQFLDGLSQQYLDEEIYFMCSTEVCLPSERRCVEGCFDGRKIPVLENPNADRRCTRLPCPGKETPPDS